MDIVPDQSPRPTILVVDDTPENLSLMGDILKDEYRVKIANNGQKALSIAQSPSPPDLILLDINMPDMDGYEICRRLKASPASAEIPVIFLTARTDLEAEEEGLRLGAVDYIMKPISPPIFMSRIKTQLHLKAVADFLKDTNAFLQQEVERRTQEVYASQDVAILALASLAETRDNETGSHLRRTQLYIQRLAQEMRDLPSYKDYLTDNNIRMLFKSAPLHDIGKVGIPDHILLKPARLSPDEFGVMKTHARLGWEALDRAEKWIGASMDFLKTAKEIALYHHEKWDGSGYPEGLAGEAIPLSARFMAVADVYDALSSPRVYHTALPHAEVMKIMNEGRARHFDPAIIDTLNRIEDEFQAIALRYTDADSDIVRLD